MLVVMASNRKDAKASSSKTNARKKPMSTMTADLQDAKRQPVTIYLNSKEKKWIDERAEQGGFRNPSELVRFLIRPRASGQEVPVDLSAEEAEALLRQLQRLRGKPHES
jgi:Arc/MetJ-type ribon-helix-helix transcriptional regulator